MILADYKLPAFDGLSALEIVKEMSPDLPFIFVSGAMGEEAAVEMLRRDASEFPGHNHFEFYPSDAKEIFERVVETKEYYGLLQDPSYFLTIQNGEKHTGTGH